MKPEHEEYVVSEALDSYPLAPLPEGFIAGIIAQVEPYPLWKTLMARVNQAAFLPAALWSFFVGFAVVLSGLGWWVYSQVNPVQMQLILQRWMYFRFWVGAYFLHTEIPPLLILILIGMVFVIFLLLTWVWTDPRRRSPYYS